MHLPFEQLHVLKIIVVGGKDIEIYGHIKSHDDQKILVEIDSGVEYLKDMVQLGDVIWITNQTPYQIQLDAIKYIGEHQLFPILIINPLYSERITDSMEQTENLR